MFGTSFTFDSNAIISASLLVVSIFDLLFGGAGGFFVSLGAVAGVSAGR